VSMHQVYSNEKGEATPSLGGRFLKERRKGGARRQTRTLRHMGTKRGRTRHWCRVSRRGKGLSKWNERVFGYKVTCLVKGEGASGKKGTQ